MKRILQNLNAFVVFAVLCLSGTAWSQELKHPRVVELEDNLNKRASSYIKDRFPDIPFMVTAQVEPLRREVKENTSAAESLPYYDMDPEEIRDEWDNPDVPMSVLINRSKKVVINVSIPEKLRQADVDELKEGLLKYLHLTPVRDEVSFYRKEWRVNEVPWSSIYFLAAAVGILLIGLLIINRTSANRIASALSSLKLNDQNSPASASMPQMSGEKDSRENSGQKNNEVKFNDPIRLKELASKQVGFLIAQPQFPTHHDIFILDKLGRESHADLGAILSEFPAAVQEKIFAYSGEFYWLKALHAPGSLNFRCIETIQQLVQTPKELESVHWIQTVLAVWRLGEKRAQFLKTLDRDDAFAILSSLPKGLAVSDAKTAFPGSWASILDSSEKPRLKDVEKLKSIEQAALALKPLNTFEILERYKSVQEILEFLKLADPGEERDIYGAAPPTSMIHTLRSPFYKVFEAPEDKLKEIVQRFSTDKWAYALFNLAKPDRVKIESHFSEKQRFQFIERIKRLDAAPPSKYAVGNAREEIASVFSQLPTAKEQTSDPAIQAAA